MGLIHRSRYSRSRVLRLLAESLSRPDLLHYEPSIAVFREEITELENAINSCVPFEQCLKPWIGNWSLLADISAEHGCFDEWLRTTADFLHSRLVYPYYIPVCLSTFIKAGIPLSESLPACASLMDGQEPEGIKTALMSGESLAGIVGNWEAYPAPFVDWLQHAEDNGDLEAFHSRLRELLLERELIWPPEPDIGKTRLDRSLLLIIRFGLDTGLPLESILSATLGGHDDAPWWADVQAQYESCDSLADALYAGYVISPLGLEILRRAEAAGRIGDALLSLAEYFDDGLLYPAVPASGTKKFTQTAAQDESDSPVDVDVEAVNGWIDNISIRGRMAYVLLCVETTLNQWNIASGEIRSILAKFWEFTSSTELDIWDTEAQRVQPYLYAFYEDFLHKKQWREMAEFLSISELTERQQETLGRELVCLHGLSANLFSGYESELTAAPLLEIIKIMVASGLTLPDRISVSLSSVEEDGGWGHPRPRHFFL